jgi:hypothetical protein
MVEKIALVSSVLLGISEALSLIPSIKSNGIVQLVINLLKSIAGK